MLRLAPPTRLLLGGAGLAAALISDPARPGGALVLAASVLLLLGGGGLPGAVLRRVALLGAVLLLPVFLIIPLLPGSPPAGGPLGVLTVPTRIVARGLAVMLVSAVTLGSLGGTDLGSALVRLRVPRVLTAILLQILHQTGALLGETRRLSGALAVRGATGGGRAALRVMCSLPTLWLPRVAERAERVAAAMELRGFGPGAPVTGGKRLGRADVLVLLVTALWLGVVGLVRHGGG